MNWVTGGDGGENGGENHCRMKEEEKLSIRVYFADKNSLGDALTLCFQIQIKNDNQLYSKKKIHTYKMGLTKIPNTHFIIF